MEATFPYQKSATGVSTYSTICEELYVSHNIINIPEFCSCVMNSNVRLNLNVWKSACMLVRVSFRHSKILCVCCFAASASSCRSL